MLQLIKQLRGSDVQELEEERVDSGVPMVTDYNSKLQQFSTVRTAYTITGWDKKKLNAYLQSHPDACIYNIVSHDPIPIEGEKLEDLASEQRILINKEPYVDLFGRYVYILSQVSWTYKEDIDSRFEGGVYPESIPQELLIYQQ